MAGKSKAVPELPPIHSLRGLKVVVDAELAKLYGVPVKALNQAVQRNANRFPKDFCFVASDEEVANLRSQIVTASAEGDGLVELTFGKGRKRHGGRRTPPRVFTEHGALMAANVLRSKRAVEMSVYLVRAFVQMRETMLAHADVLKRLAEIDGRLIEHDSVLREIARRFPRSEADLADIRNVGPKRAADLGEAILGVVRQHGSGG